MKPRKTWLKAEYWATKATLEVAQAAFSECGAVGIEVDDGELPEGKRKFCDDHIMMAAYFEPKDTSKDLVVSTMAHFFGECEFQLGEITFSSLKEDDWQAHFVRSCTTFKVDPHIFIVPSFEIDQFKKDCPNELFIEIDPENAFGTGQHQTTKLCLKNIYEIATTKAKEIPTQWSCLDVGTGSGILSILMKKLLVSSVLATETDEDALITAHKNAHKNGVSFTGLLVQDGHTYEEQHFDLVVANILAPVLIDMAAMLIASLLPGGFIILSGILKDQAESVVSVYELLGCQVLKKDIMDDWCALVMKRPTSHGASQNGNLMS